jgi:type IV pilus assembly protein PilV
MKRINGGQAGFSLIEVLVALIVLGIGMLGMGKMLILSMKSNSTAYSNTQAMSLASAMLDRIRANRAVALSGASSNYSLPTLTTTSSYGAGPNCLTAACSSADIATSDVANWLGSLAASNGLPSGQGSINFTTANNQVSVLIRVQWDDSVAQKALKEIVNPANVTITAVL